MIRCGNKVNLGEHTHETAEQVRTCYGNPQPLPTHILGRPAAAPPRSPTAVDNAPCGCNGYHGDGSHCYTCGRRRVTDTRLIPSSQLYVDVPVGRYALVIAGDVRFYQLDKPKQGKWVGWTFLSELFGAPGNFNKEPIRSNALKADIIARIDASPASEAAALFGRKLGICGRCSSPLTTVRSRAAGYGEICADKLGWPYPSEDKARVMLGEVGLAEPTAYCP